MNEVELSAGAVRYRDSGSGPPLVFVHGLLVDSRLWDPLVAELADGFRCILPDWPLGAHTLPLRPHADRTPPGLARLIADFIAALDLSDVTLVGNDTGGALSQIVVTRHPERIGRLVLTPCDAYDNFLPPAFRPLQWLARVPGLLTALGQPLRLDPVRRVTAIKPLTKRGVPAEVHRSWSGAFFGDRGVRRDAIGLLRSISPRYTQEAARELARFDRPALIAWTPKNRFFPFEHAQRLAHTIPDARLERIEDSRTFVSIDQPRRLADLIRGFVPAA